MIVGLIGHKVPVITITKHGPNSDKVYLRVHVYTGQNQGLFNINLVQGVISLRCLGGKVAPNLVKFGRNKELLNFSETALGSVFK